MAITFDSHLHSCHSGDSEASMQQQIEAGLSRGLTGMCFTEHYDMDFPYYNTPDIAQGLFELDLDSYRKDFISMQDKYEGLMDLGWGIELGIQPHLGERLKKYVCDHSGFDMIIGSTHICEHMDPYYPAFFEGRSEQDAFRSYFKESLASIRAFHDFDTYGHLDYVVRYGANGDRNYEYEDYADIIDQILRELIRNGIALEVNTSALGKGCRHFNPAPAVLTRYRKMGGELITVGSDAHVPENIALRFNDTAEILKDLGFRYYAVFRHRKAQMLPL